MRGLTCACLVSILSRYLARFEAEDIVSWSVLAALEERHLVELGFSIGDRLRFLQCLQSEQALPTVVVETNTAQCQLCSQQVPASDGVEIPQSEAHPPSFVCDACFASSDDSCTSPKRDELVDTYDASSPTWLCKNLLDFADARAGHRLFDFVSLHIDVFCCDPVLLLRCLKACVPLNGCMHFLNGRYATYRRRGRVMRRLLLSPSCLFDCSLVGMVSNGNRVGLGKPCAWRSCTHPSGACFPYSNTSLNALV